MASCSWLFLTDLFSRGELGGRRERKTPRAPLFFPLQGNCSKSCLWSLSQSIFAYSFFCKQRAGLFGSKWKISRTEQFLSRLMQEESVEPDGFLWKTPLLLLQIWTFEVAKDLARKASTCSELCGDLWIKNTFCLIAVISTQSGIGWVSYCKPFFQEFLPLGLKYEQNDNSSLLSRIVGKIIWDESQWCSG